MSALPPLKYLHSHLLLNRVKLDVFRRMSDSELVASLAPGNAGSLKARPDGTLLDGHHRIAVLVERGYETNRLPREIMKKDTDDDS